MVRDKNDILTFLHAHKVEMAQRFGVVSVGLFGVMLGERLVMILTSTLP